MKRAPGFAMVGALLALAVAAIFGATIADLGRTELLLARNVTRFTTALAALDECAAIVARSMPLGWEFAAVLAGPDAVPGTADDGTLAAPAPCVAAVRPLGGPTPRILVNFDTSRDGGRRAGSAIVGRAPVPGPAALLWIDAATRAGAVAGMVRLDGAVAGATPWAAMAAPDDPAVLDAWIASSAGRADVSSPTSAPIWSPGPPLAAIVSEARAAGPAPAATGLTPAVPAPELLTIAEGNLAVTDARWARGVLVVTGRLEVATGGRLVLQGLLVALDGVVVAAGGSVDVAGAVWSGTAPPGALDVAGALRVGADPAALARAATILTLPHEPRVLGWLDR